LLATDVGERFPQDDESALKLFQRYATEVGRLAREKVRIVVLPEKIAVVSDRGIRDLDALFEKIAVHAQAHVIVGVDQGRSTRRLNEAPMYSPNGTLAAIYVKHHLISPFEDVDEPGTEIKVSDEPSGAWGMQICKDMDFPALSRQYGCARIGL